MRRLSNISCRSVEKSLTRRLSHNLSASSREDLELSTFSAAKSTSTRTQGQRLLLEIMRQHTNPKAPKVKSSLTSSTLHTTVDMPTSSSSHPMRAAPSEPIPQPGTERFSSELSHSIKSIDYITLLKVFQMSTEPPRLLLHLLEALLALFADALPRGVYIAKTLKRAWNSVQMLGSELARGVFDAVQGYRKICCSGKIQEANINEVLRLLQEITSLPVDGIHRSLLEFASDITVFLKNAVEFWDLHAPNRVKKRYAAAALREHTQNTPGNAETMTNRTKRRVSAIEIQQELTTFTIEDTKPDEIAPAPLPPQPLAQAKGNKENASEVFQGALS